MTETRTRITPLVAAAVAGLALGLVAAWIFFRPAPVQPSVIDLTNRKTAIVPLQLDSSGNVIGIDQPVSDDQKSNGKEVGLSKSKREYAEWSVYPPSADVDLTIDMKVDSPEPFAGPFQKFDHNKKVRSMNLRTGVPERTYDYRVEVRDMKTGKPFRLDPPIRVDP